MNDIDYVREVLSSDFKSSKDDEVPYPDLEFLKENIEFDYSSGKISGEEPNGSKSREEKPYLWFKFYDKRILSHRFIVALTLGKWPPREFHVDHINHDPSDNRPENLRVVTPRDNSRNRRKATLPELVDIGTIAEELAKAKLEKLEVRKKLEEAQKSQQDATEAAGRSINKSKDDEFYSQNWNSTPKLRELQHSEVATLEREKTEDNARGKTSAEPPMSHFYSITQVHPVFTGETKPAVPSGVWHKTTIGSWWWRKD